MRKTNQIYLSELCERVFSAEKQRETNIQSEKDKIVRVEKEMAARADVSVLETLPKLIENAVLDGQDFMDLPVVARIATINEEPLPREHLYRACLRFEVPIDSMYRIKFRQLKELRMKP